MATQNDDLELLFFDVEWLRSVPTKPPPGVTLCRCGLSYAEHDRWYGMANRRRCYAYVPQTRVTPSKVVTERPTRSIRVEGR